MIIGISLLFRFNVRQGSVKKRVQFTDKGHVIRKWQDTGRWYGENQCRNGSGTKLDALGTINPINHEVGSGAAYNSGKLRLAADARSVTSNYS